MKSQQITHYKLILSEREANILKYLLVYCRHRATKHITPVTNYIEHIDDLIEIL